MGFYFSLQHHFEIVGNNRSTLAKKSRTTKQQENTKITKTKTQMKIYVSPTTNKI